MNRGTNEPGGLEVEPSTAGASGGRDHGTTKIRIDVMTFQQDPDAGPFQVKGRHAMRPVISGNVELPEGEYLTRVTICDENHEHPLADVPFMIGLGHWIWLPPYSEVEEDPDE